MSYFNFIMLQLPYVFFSFVFDLWLFREKTKNNTIQYNTMQHNTMQYNTMQHNTMQYNTMQHNTLQYNTMQ